MSHSKTDEQVKKNRKVILGIFGIPALVFLLSTGLYFLVETKAVDLGTVNNGQLITPPLPFAELPLTTLTGEAFDYSKPEPKWAFVVLGDRYCQGECERMLYIARQSIISLGKKMGRLRLIYVNSDTVIEPALQQRFTEEYRGMDVVVLEKKVLQDMFKNIDPYQQRTFYVVDPRGWMMMYYQVEDTDQETLATLGKAVARDMKRLIK